jgi:hypothetical protein
MSVASDFKAWRAEAEQIGRDLQLNRQVAAVSVLNCRIHGLLVCRGEPKSLVEFTGPTASTWPQKHSTRNLMPRRGDRLLKEDTQ